MYSALAERARGLGFQNVEVIDMDLGSSAAIGAKRREGPEMTFHDFTGTPDRRIDYLFLRGFRADAIATDTWHRGKTYPSDHFPVRATLSFADEIRR